MITDIIFFIIGIIVQIITAVFSAISWSLPVSFFTAVSTLLAKLSFVDVLLPVGTLMGALSIFLVFIVFWYGMKLTMWVYHLIRHGGDVDLPGLTKYRDQDIIRKGYLHKRGHIMANRKK